MLSSGFAFGQDVPIHDIQYTTDPQGNSPLNGQVVATGGIVTGVTYGGSPIRYFINQSGGGLWSGILINDNQNRGLSVGDSVHLEGEVQESNTQTRLRNIVSFTTVPAAGTVAPTVVATGSVDESTEGVLIELRQAVVVSVGTTTFVVNDGSGSATVGDGWDYQFAPQIGDTLTYLRGIVAAAPGSFTINPRNDLDFGFVGNRPPVISQVQHTPATPTELESDTVSALIVDDTAVTGATIHYRFGETGAFLEQAMFDDGLHGDGAAGDGRWGGVIPAGPARATAYYYISAVDDLGARATSPADAPATTYQYTIRSTTLAIYDLQYCEGVTGCSSPYAEQNVTFTGIVTGPDFGGRTTFFVSDLGGGAWSGIEVYNPPAGAAVGDCVRVSGKLVEFNGTTEISPVNSVTVLGRGTPVAAFPIRTGIISDSCEPYESCLVRLGQCWVTDVSQFQQYREFEVSDGSGDGLVIVGGSYSFGLEYEPTEGDTFRSIVGIVTYNGNIGQWLIAPRDDEDLDLVDVRPPIFRSVSVVSPREINVTFNEPLLPAGIGNLDNYQIIDQSDPSFPALHIARAYLFSSGRTIHIEMMNEFNDSSAYRLEIDRVADVVGNESTDIYASFGSWEPGEYVPIEAIYNDFAAYDGQLVTLRGVVNFVQDVTTTSGSRRISAFIQDESSREVGGVTIPYGFSLSQSGAASTFPDIQRGNLIEITGRVTEYQGTIQLGEFSAASVVKIAQDVPMPEPIVVETGDRRLQRQIVRTSRSGAYGAGTWVETTGAIRAVDENVGGGTNIQIDDGTGNITIRVWDSMNLDSVRLDTTWYRMRELAGKRVTIAGPSSTYNGDFQMLAGYAEDFRAPDDGWGILPSEALTLEVGNSIEATGNFAPNRPFAPDLGQKLTVRLNTPAMSEVRLRVFDLRGHLVTTLWNNGTGGAQVIEWDGRDDRNNLLPLGTYILHLECVQNGKTDSKTKPVVIGTRL